MLHLQYLRVLHFVYYTSFRLSVANERHGAPHFRRGVSEGKRALGGTRQAGEGFGVCRLQALYGCSQRERHFVH